MSVLLNLLSGVALLIWGTNLVQVGILRVYGANLRKILAVSVTNRFTAFLAGVGVTGLVQSSNATAVIVSSFVARGLIALAPALAIMLGANVGTAVMVQVFALDLSWLSPFLIFIGVILHLSRKGSRVGHVGRVLTGLGLITLALELISVASRPVVEAAGVKVLFASLTGDIMLDMLIGALFTLLCYSSLAVVLFCGTLASAGVVSIPVALGLVLGANLGSGVSALMSTTGSNQPGKRVALGNLLSRVIGCAVALPVVHLAAGWLAQLDWPAHHVVVGFHLLFNIVLAILLIGFTGQVAHLCERLLPGNASNDAQVSQRHLDPAALSTPALALSNAAREVLRIGDRVEQMLVNLLQILKTDDVRLTSITRRMDDEIDTLYTDIKLYLTRLSHEELDDKDSRRWTEIITLTINLEHAGDIIDRMLQDIKDKKIAHHLKFAEAGMAELTEMHGRLIANLRLGLSVFLTEDQRSAQHLMEEKMRFRELERRLELNHLARIASQTPDSIETSSLHLDLIGDMKRLNSLFCTMAYPALDESAGSVASPSKSSAPANVPSP